MQIIQTIRDKGAALVIAVIALSLIGFLLMDAKSGNKGANGFLNSLNSSVGKVNSNTIEKGDFDKKIKSTDDMAKQQTQQSGRLAPGIAQIRDQVWNQMVAENIFLAEANKVGIDFTGKELYSILQSNDQNNPLLRQQGMVDSTTGQIDQSKVQQVIANIKKAKGTQAEARDEQLIEPLTLPSIASKYTALLNASAYYPTWMQQADVAKSKNFANISYVAVPYNVISDSTIKVSDDDIATYVAAHKNLFKQEAGRMISYVTVSQLASAADSAKIKEEISGLKESFITATNNSAFVARNGSVIEYDSNYVPKARLKTSKLDSITKLSIGIVYGPYIDGGNYVLAKYLGSKTMADSAKARHILIATINPQTGQQLIPDSIAKKQADSILYAIKAGADFATLAKKFSADPGSKDKGGVYDYFAYGQMVPEFNEFCFSKAAGTLGVVKTSYGYHVIEAMGQKGNSPVYKIAFMAKPIVESDETIQTANSTATKLSGVKSGKEFDDYIAKNGLHKISWPQIVKENDFQVGQMQDARELVRWAFEAKKNDVSTPFNMKDQFVVATVDKILDEGTQDVKSARAFAEPTIRNQKKAAQIIKQLGTTPTLETSAAAYKQEIKTAGADSSITFNSAIIPNIGNEPKLIGACFNKENQTKPSAPIEGNNAMYIVKVNNINTKPADTPEALTQQKTQTLSALRNQINGWFEGLKKQATITDNRSKFY